jgi:hypothetical protein
MGQEKAEDLVDELMTSTRQIGSLDLSPLQIEIVRELMDGKRTLTEIALKIYGVRYGDASYEAVYSRLRRAVAGLEKTGIVSRSGLFGRGKPYHLTQFGVACLAKIAPGMEKPRIMTFLDQLILGLILPLALISYYLSETGGQAYIASIAILFFFIGVGVSRSIQIMRRVS